MLIVANEILVPRLLIVVERDATCQHQRIVEA